MPKKKSIKKSAETFISHADTISAFLTAANSRLSDHHVSWAYEYGILRLYREFETLILGALVGAINNDTTTISSRAGISFPKHLTDEVCEYLIIGDGYFDFKGRDGLIRTLKDFVPDDNFLVDIVKKVKYKQPLERLSALRNLAAHNSSVSKARAKDALGQKKMPEAGVWLMKQNRLGMIISALKDIAAEVKDAAPY